MALPDIEALTQLAFAISENKGIFAVLIGSGLSRAASIPTGWEITLDLIRRIAAAQGVTDEPDWASWFVAKNGVEPDYSKLLEALGSTPAERRSILHAYIEPTDADRESGAKRPTPAHYSIADLVLSGHIKVIVTTNFDRLMETALRERGIEPTVVSSVDGLRGAEPLTHSRCYVFKVHGDYKDDRILNTDGELSKYPKEFNALLDRIFDEHGIIISGWSGDWDEALRRAMLRAPNRRYPIYWSTRGDLRERAAELAQQRGAKVIKIKDANSLFCDVRGRVETLEKARRVNPRSVELTVASAKRFVARSEYRIELDHLVTEEADQLSRIFVDEMLSTQGRWSVEEFRNRIARYEAATETLARIVGVLGRWGDGSELALITDLVKSHYAKANNHAGGLVAWSSLRSYPAVMISTAYGLGLARTQRWHDLHKFFRREIPRENRQPKPLAEVLVPASWDGSSNDYWRSLESFEQRRTALSDHLLDLYSDWGKSFAGLTEDFELLYDRFEMLASLAYFENQTLEELQKRKASQQNQQFGYAISGRFGWRSAAYETLTRELQSDALKPKLLDAGFAHGSSDFLGLFIENLPFVAQRMRWG